MEIKAPPKPAIGGKSGGGIKTAKPSIGAPKLEPLSVNPLDKAEAQHTGDIEHDTNVDNSAMLNEFEAIKKGEESHRQAVALANDTRFWCAIYFQSHQQKMEFLEQMGLQDHGQQYLDGEHVAKVLGIKLTPREVPYKVGKIDKSLKDLT